MTLELNRWRAAMAAQTDEAGRWFTFAQAAAAFAESAESAIERTVAVDCLQNLATAWLDADATDRAQGIIVEKFKDVPSGADWIKQDKPKPNGKGRHKPRIQSKAEFVAGFVPPDYLVDGILQRRFIYSLTGLTGHAKTAVALLIASLVASTEANVTLGDRRVEHGRVIYFVGENPDDVRMRVIGRDHRRGGVPTDDRIFFIPGIFNIAEMFSVLDDDMRRNGEAVLIIIDTSAAYFVGKEELNNVEMGAYARLLRTLTTLPGGPCVIALCHPVKHAQEQSQLLPRGGGAYLNEMDGNLTLWRVADDAVELHHTGKFRGPDFPAMTFRLDAIDDCPALVDAKGRSITTVQAVPINQKEEETLEARALKEEDLVLAAYLADPKRSFVDIAEVCGISFRNGAPNKKKVERILRKLEKGPPKLATRNRHGWALTELGKEQAREVALRLEKERADQDERARQESLRF